MASKVLTVVILATGEKMYVKSKPSYCVTPLVIWRALYPGAEGGGGAPAPPELQKFLLVMAVYCIEMLYLSLYTKAKKLFYLLGTPYCYMVQNSAAYTRTLRLL